jgi:hypothetical protein
VIPQGIGGIVEFRPGVFAEEISEGAARKIILEMEAQA